MNSSRFPLFSLKLLYLREQLEACKTFELVCMCLAFWRDTTVAVLEYRMKGVHGASVFNYLFEDATS